MADWLRWNSASVMASVFSIRGALFYAWGKKHCKYSFQSWQASFFVTIGA